MAFNSNGQISYYVLDSLSHGSKYGLEIIEFISQKTNGNYIMKKPTLYSCLTRMEKKGLVSSSYWGESEFGGKRHYYTITNEGKKALEQLTVEFKNAEIETNQSPANVEEDVTNQTQENKPVFLQQDNIFDMVNKEKTEMPAVQNSANDFEKDDVIENQIDIFSYQTSQTTQENQPNTVEDNKEDAEKIQYYQSILEQTSSPTKEEEEIKDDAILLENNPEKYESLTPYQEAQNKRLYDTSSELKKYRKRKSFSENQIEMSVVYEKEEDREIQKARIEQLKQSMLNARQNGYEFSSPKVEEQPIPVETEKEELSQSFEYSEEKVSVDFSQPKENVQDDAIFITNPRINPNEMPVQKRIAPPNIEVNIYDDNLPAPKRDSNLEPTYKDMMAKLFERKKEKAKPAYSPETEQLPKNDATFADYGSLKRYYAGHGISFNEYKKTSVERRHNTNFLNFVASTIMLLCSGIGCSILFWICSALNILKTGTNFMFYTLPILFVIYSIYLFIKHKLYPSKKAVLIYNSIINWVIFVLATIVILVINIFCGMEIETVALYSTSLFVPILGVLIAFPINYYTKKILYKKFAK